MTRRRPVLAGLAAAVAAGLLAGCGVPLESEARALPDGAIPLQGTASASPTASATPTESQSAVPTAEAAEVWLASEAGLVPVERELPLDYGPEALLEQLAAEPTPEEAALGLRTAVTDPVGGGQLVVVAPTQPEPDPSATSGEPPPLAIQVEDAFRQLPPNEQVIVLGQVVLTMSASGYPSVVFTDSLGAPLAVPLPDGLLASAPVTAADYSSLIAP